MSVLEVIACTVADALEAQKGGAERLEVVRNLDRGGLTPSIELVRAIQEAVNLPLRVMVRESDGFATSGEVEVERLCAAAAAFSKLRVDGLVLGFLKDGAIDVDLTARVLTQARGVNATFHHAFENTADQLQVIRELKKLPQVDRILSSGGSGELETRRQRLEAYAQAAAPEMKIIAGGNIDLDTIALLKRTTQIREFHVGRAARERFEVGGAVDAELVRQLGRATRTI